MGLIELPIGSDAFRAQAISDMCKDEGIDNELVLREDHHSMMINEPHMIIVDEAQLGDVQQVVTDNFPELIHGTSVPGDAGSPARSSTPLWQRLVLAGGIIAPIVAVIYTQLS